jgi:hypothetical protein
MRAAGYGVGWLTPKGECEKVAGKAANRRVQQCAIGRGAGGIPAERAWTRAEHDDDWGKTGGSDR